MIVERGLPIVGVRLDQAASLGTPVGRVLAGSRYPACKGDTCPGGLPIPRPASISQTASRTCRPHRQGKLGCCWRCAMEDGLPPAPARKAATFFPSHDAASPIPGIPAPACRGGTPGRSCEWRPGRPRRQRRVDSVERPLRRRRCLAPAGPICYTASNIGVAAPPRLC